MRFKQKPRLKMFAFIISLLFFYVIIRFGLHLHVKTKRLNIILIVSDSLRPDHLGCYGYKRDTSPNIDKLAKEGVLFTEAIAQGSHTAPSITSLLTSSYPNIHNVKDWGYKLNSDIHLYMLPEILRLHGFKTALISEQIGLSLIKGLEKGFDTYNTILTNEFYPEHNHKIVRITDWAIDWLNNNKDNRFFILLYYLDPHGPYFPQPPFNTLFLNDEQYDTNESIPISDNTYIQTTVGKIPKYLAINDITEVDYYVSQYDGEIGYVDSEIGRLYKELERLSLDKNTIIIITSDHGEGMGEHNFYFCHAIFLYDELIRVPLIIKFNSPNIYGKKVDMQVRSIDIFPTIMDILRLDIKNYKTIQGASLLPLINNQKCDFPPYAYSEFLKRRSIRTKQWKLIYNGGLNDYELYNLKKDPQELNNLVSMESAEFQFLQHKLNDFIKQGNFEGKAEERVFFPEGTKEKLRSLGYM